jgi:exonuclease SbcC
VRPIELTLSGFRSYVGTATFCFEGRHLVGIVGPIGSGKSSILDAVAFALYGKTPRVGRDTKSLINQRREEARVTLTFSVDGERWKVVRALRRKGQSAHLLYRVDDGQEVEEADREREVEGRIEALLGLDWDGFRRSVLLAQNQFAGFLEATRGERDGVLKGVFGFERLDGMRAAAKQRLDGVAAEIAALTRLRAQAEHDRQGLEAAANERAAAAVQVEALRVVARRVAEADRDSQEAALAQKAAGDEAKRLAVLAEQIPPPERTEALFADAARTGAAVEAAEEGARRGEAQAKEAEAAFQAALEAAGGRGTLDEAAGLVARAGAERQAAEQATARAVKAEAAAKDAGAAAVAAGKTVGTAEKERAAAAKAGQKASKEREQAAAALHQAHRSEAALALRAGLEVGAPCPVCEQPVAALPRARKAADLAKAERALEQAEAAERDARDRTTTAEASLAVAREAAAAAGREGARAAREAAEAEEAAQSAAAALAVVGHRLADLLGEGDPVVRLDERRSRVAAAEAAAGAARLRVEEARRARADTQRQAREVGAGLQAMATGLAAVAGRLGADLEVGGDPEILQEAFRRLRELQNGASREVEERRLAAVAGARAASSRRSSLLEGAGLPPGADASAVLLGAERGLAGVEGRIAVLQERLSELDRLEREEQETVGRHALLQRLHADLAPAAFQAYVLDERRRDLAALGSAQFEMLSGGRYRFSEDGEFAVVDLAAAEAMRPAASLSGGETFLASLGLALALAEMVAREGGRLDAFFLDEGFGSLDPEHLDLAMEGVERLSAGADRLVVVVSHVVALQERIEDLIVLGKAELTGDTVVVGGASPDG